MDSRFGPVARAYECLGFWGVTLSGLQKGSQKETEGLEPALQDNQKATSQAPACTKGLSGVHPGRNPLVRTHATLLTKDRFAPSFLGSQKEGKPWECALRLDIEKRRLVHFSAWAKSTVPGPSPQPFVGDLVCERC